MWIQSHHNANQNLTNASFDATVGENKANQMNDLDNRREGLLNYNYTPLLPLQVTYMVDNKNFQIPD